MGLSMAYFRALGSGSRACGLWGDFCGSRAWSDLGETVEAGKNPRLRCGGFRCRICSQYSARGAGFFAVCSREGEVQFARLGVEAKREV